ncbi:uncharacterized protein BO97DRAFT_446989 [Aspergillus homomorphus CBS 101889]|uniref:N-acetyltransferase domain-containing protein n=1 Tax=Aspergillus homomorphus (strain CBS 101889) TaxID=1450537 RepID=A0A395HLV7_ASPHC|nr:hypothetical protein BO97DRAFT_446989 [Aspergillus homomorphus CBS 101889]RAL07254.1 hypothetical protein BO97DRAFT_446989 [Aspergillus homomorphus CBS 101889]
MTPPPCQLRPINLHDPSDFTEMQRQRQICGWDHEAPKIESWRNKQDEGLKGFYWVCIPDPSSGSSSSSSSSSSIATTSSSTIRAGHISLDAYSDPPDADLARADRSVLTVQTLFILPEYRGLGLGRRAMDLVEEKARTQEPKCRYLALTTLSERHFVDESPEGTGVWARTGSAPPRMGCNQWWYARRGYVFWKEEPRWTDKGLDGSEVAFYAAFMRMDVRAGVEGEGGKVVV